MAHRFIDENFWRSKKVRNLSDDGRLAYLFLITIGGLTGVHDRLPEEFAILINWPLEKWEKAVGELTDKDRIKSSQSGRLLWVRGHIEHNFLGPGKKLSPLQKRGMQNALKQFPPDLLLDEVQRAYPDIFAYNGWPENPKTADPAQKLAQKMEPPRER